MTNVLGFPDDDTQAVGSWQEIVQGEGFAGKAVQRMSLHYSDEKALASAEAKREVLAYFFHLIQGHSTASAVLSGNGTFMPREALTWEEFAQLHHVQVAAQHGPRSLASFTCGPTCSCPPITRSIRRAF